MGNGSSRPPEYTEAISIFTEGEREQIAAIFHGIRGPEKRRFNEQDFKSYCDGRLSANLESCLYRYMLNCLPTLLEQGHHLQTVSSEMFHVTLAHLLKGSLEQHANLLYMLIANQKEQHPLESLRQCIFDLLSVYPNTMLSQKELKTWDVSCSDSSMQLLAQCLVKDVPTNDTDEVNATQLEKWLSTCGLVTHIIENVFHHIFPVSFVDTVDSLVSSQPLFPYTDSVDWTQYSTILDIPSILLLSYSLPHDLRSPWRLLFTSRKHGESFSTMLKCTLNKGPCLFIIRDTEGHVFGGFATESLTVRPQFVGNSYSFLFSLAPTMSIYPATGLNHNYMYLNQLQETMPNGLGFGGQLGYFGLWLDHNYGEGHSKATPNPCTTYGSPQLSAHETFHFTHLEVWGLGQDPAVLAKLQEEEGAGAPDSILDSDPSAKAMLSLLDRGGHSEGLRETDCTADVPEQHTLNG